MILLSQPLKRIFLLNFFIVLFTIGGSIGGGKLYACNSSSFSIDDAVDNGDGTYTLDISFTVEYGTSDDAYGYWGSVFEFISSSGTQPTVVSWSPAMILPNGGLTDPLTGYIDPNINVNNWTEFDQFEGFSNMFSYEYQDPNWDAAFNDFDGSFSITIDGCFETVQFYANPMSSNSVCNYTQPSGLACAPAVSPCECSNPVCGGMHYCSSADAFVSYVGTGSDAQYDFSTPLAFTLGTSYTLCWEYTTGANETTVGFTNQLGFFGFSCNFDRSYNVYESTCGNEVFGNGVDMTALGFLDGDEYSVSPNTAYTFCVTVTAINSDCVELVSNFMFLYGACPCDADAGTYDITGVTVPVFGEDQPSDFTVPCCETMEISYNFDGMNAPVDPLCGVAELGYAIFLCDPTGLDFTDEDTYSAAGSGGCYWGIITTSATQTDTNDDGLSGSFGVSDIWVVPVTLDCAGCTGPGCGPDDVDGNNDDCVDFSGPFHFDYEQGCSSGGCGTCPSPCTEDGMGNVPTYDDRSYTSCWVPECLIVGDFFTPVTFTNCFDVQADPSGFLGVALLLDVNTQTAVFCGPTIVNDFDLFEDGNCGSSITPATPEANDVSTDFNPEWTGLNPNGDYVLCVEFILNDDLCQLDPNNPLGADGLCMDFYGNDCTAVLEGASMDGFSCMGDGITLSNTTSWNQTAFDAGSNANGTETTGFLVFCTMPVLPLTEAYYDGNALPCILEDFDSVGDYIDVSGNYFNPPGCGTGPITTCNDEIYILPITISQSGPGGFIIDWSCFDTDDPILVELGVPPTPTATADPTTICEGESSTLTATGGGSYNWSDGLGTNAMVTVSPTTTTTYTVTVTDDSGLCEITAEITVTVTPMLPCDDGICSNGLETWNTTTCMCDPGTPVTDPGCDDGICSNGLETWNTTTCMCDPGTPVTDPGCDDGICSNGLETWNTTTCMCDPGTPVTDPGCDDGICSNGLETWNTTTCMCDPGTPVTDPGCDDGICSNGLETWNTTTCMCDPGTPVTDPGCDDGICSNGLETWNTTTCMCDPGTPVTDPGCDDGICSNGLETWNTTTCMCDPGTPPVPCADDGNCNNGFEVWNSTTCNCDITPPMLGCTNPTADNYDPTATCDDGSCTFPCPDPGTCDDGICSNGLETWNGITCMCDPGTPVTDPGCDDGICSNGLETWNTTTCMCDPGTLVTDPGCDDGICSNGLETWNTTTCMCDPGTPVTDPGCDDGICSNGLETWNATTCMCDPGTPVTDPGCDDGICSNGLETWNTTTCMCDPGTPVTDPGCDDGICSNGLETWNTTTCMCDPGTPVTDPGCDDGICSNGLETWNTTTCMCDPGTPVTDPGCDDGICSNGLETWNTTTCMCDPGTPPVPCVDDGNCNNGFEVWNSTTCNCDITPPMLGCTNPTADNYDSTATCDDGSCTFACPDPGTCDDGICSNGLEIWNGVTCMCDPGTPVTDPGCDDGICSNGLETWNTMTCMCDPGTPVTDPGCDDGICSNGLETWNTTTCICDPGTPVTDPGCDDGICSNGLETWNTTTCMCDPGTPPVPCVDDGDCTNGFEVWNSTTCNCDITPPIFGCTNPTADNYDPTATCDDTSCTFACPDPGTCDDGICSNGLEIWNGVTCMCDPGTPVTDPGCDDGICSNGLETWNTTTCMCDPGTPPVPCIDDGDCTNGFESWNDTTCFCDIVPPVFGCLDITADNYDPLANCESNDCTFGCSNPVSIAVNPINPICENESISLSIILGGPSVNLNWTSSGDGVFDNQSMSDPTYTPGLVDISLGSVLLIVTTDDPDGNGPCEAATDNVLLIIESLITPTFVNPGPLCQSDASILLSDISLEGITGSWSPSLISPNSGIDVITIFLPDVDQCANDIDMTIDVNQSELPTFTIDDEYCLNDIADLLPLISDNGFNGTWNPSTIATSAVGNTQYTFTSSDDCVTDFVLNVLINDCSCMTPAELNLAGDTEVCSTESIVISANLGGAATSVSWSTDGDGTFNSSVNIDAVYTPGQTDVLNGGVTLTAISNDPDGTGPCDPIEESVEIVIYSVPDAPQVNPITVCQGDENPSIIAMGENLIWYDVNGIEISEPSIDSSIPSINEYWVSQTQNNCESDLTSVVITVNGSPIVDAGTQSNIGCGVASIMLEGTSSVATSNQIVQWTGPSILGGASTLNPEVDIEGIYYMSVVDSSTGCSAIDSIIVTSNTMELGVDLEVFNPLCDDGSTGSINIVEIIGGVGPYTYYLDGLIVPISQYDALPEGEYAILISDVNGCEFNVITEIAPVQNWTIELDADKTSIELGEQIQLTTQLNNLDEMDVQSVSWNPDGSMTCDDCLVTFDAPLVTTTYEVEVEDINGCLEIANIEVIVQQDEGIFFPNIMVKDDSSENGKFFPFANIDEIVIVDYLTIFDRWGNVVFKNSNFEPNNPDLGWDGYYNGVYVESGVYVYVAQFTTISGEKSVYSGDLTVID